MSFFKQTIQLSIAIVILFVSLAAASMGMYFFMRSQYEKESPKTTEIIAAERIEKVAKFAVVEYFMSDILSHIDEKKWPFRDTKVLIIIRGKILGGFDISKGKSSVEVISSEKSNSSKDEIKKEEDKKTIVITLPSPKILSIEADYEYYDIQGDVPIETHNWVLGRAKRSLRDAALKAGILDKAKESVIFQMKQILIDYNVIVKFTEDLPIEKKAE